MDGWALVASERLALADWLDELTPDQWLVPSLCPGWTVKGIAAHLVSALMARPRDILAVVVEGRGSPARMTTALASRWSDTPTDELVARLREQAENHFRPPGLGFRAPLTDLMVHRLDAAVPLGLEVDRPVEPWSPVLDFLTGRVPLLGTIRGGRPRLSFRAADLDWEGGRGPLVTGPAAALGLTMAGRDAWTDRLSGPGAAELARWAAA